MTGEVDPLYVGARRTLLDALAALQPHLDAIVLVGAQAIYVHTGEADLTAEFRVAEYTTDADIVMQPEDLAGSPLVMEALATRGFTAETDPGRWISPDGFYLDLMIPEALAGPGKRGARLGVHGKRAARRAKGLEGALVDREKHLIRAFDPADERSQAIWVAGPAALLVGKTHKIAERTDAHDRVRDKDALDLLRLLRAVSTETLADGLRVLVNSDLAGAVTAEAQTQLAQLFATHESEGVAMAVRAADATGDEALTIAASLVMLVADLLDAIR